MQLRCLILASILAGAAPAAVAVQVLDARVARTGEVYRVDFAVRLDGDVREVARLARDYRRFAKLSPTVIESRIINQSSEHTRVEVTLRPCVFVVFCKTIVKVSDARIDDTGTRMEFTAVPALGDFHEAHELITITEEPAAGRPAVRFTYAATLKPKFFVPPFVGPWLVRRHIIEDLKATSERVERIVNGENETHGRQ